MAEKRRKHAKEFKVEAVRLVLEQGRTVADVARSLGISKGLLATWRRDYQAQSQQAFPGQGKRTAHDEEVWQLKKKLARAEQERDILKKALAYFANEPK